MIGSVLGSVDYWIPNNLTVSRHHAEISLEKGEYVLTDQNSTNKTYVNNCALLPLNGKVLKNGDQLGLANELFTFVCET